MCECDLEPSLCRRAQGTLTPLSFLFTVVGWGRRDLSVVVVDLALARARRCSQPAIKAAMGCSVQKGSRDLFAGAAWALMMLMLER